MALNLAKHIAMLVLSRQHSLGTVVLSIVSFQVGILKLDVGNAIFLLQAFCA